MITRRKMMGLAGLALVSTVLAAPLAAQSPAEIQSAVDAAYAKYKDLQEGANADYIPALAAVDPNLFGIAVVTADGKVYTAGDVETEVSIQSISKPFTMALVMNEQGADAILNSIGADATGMRFNSIVSVEWSFKGLGGSKLENAAEMNPLVNPGAIATTSMVRGTSYDEIWGKILQFYGDFAGRQLTVLEDVYQSEADTNQRNQAIGKLMYAYGYIKDNPDQATDIYTRQCSVGVNARDLATMGATLAFGGNNPVTKKQVLNDGQRSRSARDHGDRRSLRRFRQVAVQDRPPGQERRGWGHRRRLAGQVWDRRDLAAARRRWQQHPCPTSDRRHFERARREPVRGSGEQEVGLAQVTLMALVRRGRCMRPRRRCRGT